MKENAKTHREKKVLEIIIQAYILAAMPISSRYVSRKLGLSSATIRNVMSDLESMGLISHPHTSAGRVPTDRGYRFYVDSLMRLKTVTEREIRQIESEYHSKVKSLEDIFEKTAHILSEVTSCAGITLLQKMEQRRFRHIDLVPLSGKRILVLIVAESGLVKDCIIELGAPLNIALLEKVSNFLNKELYSMKLEDIKDSLIKRFQAERNSSHQMVEAAYEIMKGVLIEGLKEKLYFDGTSHILAYPEFRDHKKSTDVLRFFEDKATISNILSEDLLEDKLKIHIGTENKTFGLGEFSVITAGFKVKNQTAGRLGIIGPVRMDYERVIPVVELLAVTVTKVLSLS